MITIRDTTGPRPVYICSRTDHGVHSFLSFYSINTDPQPLMTAGLADDDNMAFAVLHYRQSGRRRAADIPATTPTTKGQEGCSQAVLGAIMAQRGEEKSMGTRTRSRP